MAKKQQEQAEAARAAQQTEPEQAAAEQASTESAPADVVEGDGTGEALPPIDDASVASNDDDPLPAEEPETVECAVLHDNVYGKHGEIVHLGPAVAEAARAAGYVDTHPNALKFFREQAAK